MITPNKITIARLLIGIVGFFFMVYNFWKISFFLILISVLMDILDGKVARKFNKVTKQGVFLDVMVDKIVIISTFLIIGLKVNIGFFYLGILMLIREYSIDTMRSIAASNKEVISADKFSKIKGVIFMVAMISTLGNMAFLNQNNLLEITMVILASIGMLLAYITLFRFFRNYKSTLV